MTAPAAVVRALERAPWPRALRRSAAAREAARRLGVMRPLPLREPPALPVGAKLEMTFTCNLRCGFCYTDSPRHTLARTAELSDEQWHAIVQDVIDLGVLEAVVTGGEPLLRRELTLETVERLGAAGVAVTLNTNGWFVDDAVAARLADVPGLDVFVSLDGATPAEHDGARGVPGSWRRAVAGIDRLVTRGVAVRIVHIVTPENQAAVPAALELFWRLGVDTVLTTPVLPVGGAMREGPKRWSIDVKRLRRTAKEAQARFGDGIRIIVRSEFMPHSGGVVEEPPRAFLVRPDGSVRPESVLPFTYGNASEGLALCWERMRERWDSAPVEEWAAEVRESAPVVPYLDEDVPLVEQATVTPAGRGLPVAQPTAPRRAEPLDEPGAALAYVTTLALDREVQLGVVRSTEGERGARYVRAIDGDLVTRLNPTSAAIMDGCRAGRPRAAVEALAARHPAIPRAALEADVLAGVRQLVVRGIVVPAGRTARRLPRRPPSEAPPLLPLAR